MVARPSTLVLEPQVQVATAGVDSSAGMVSDPLLGSPTRPTPGTAAGSRTLRIYGEIPTEVWQRLGRTLIPKLKSGTDLRVGLDVSLSVDADGAAGIRHEIQQILQDLKLEGKVKVEWN